MTSVAGDILGLMRKDERDERRLGGSRIGMRPRAPKGVILYFEGLDCSGKSSTGGLVQAALEQAGYEVGMRQYNRPPTAEQRQVTTTIVPMRFHRWGLFRLPLFSNNRRLPVSCRQLSIEQSYGLDGQI